MMNRLINRNWSLIRCNKMLNMKLQRVPQLSNHMFLVGVFEENPDSYTG